MSRSLQSLWPDEGPFVTQAEPTPKGIARVVKAVVNWFTEY